MRLAGGKDILADRAPDRPSDVRHLRASHEKKSWKLGYEPTVRFEEGLGRLYEWHEK